MTAKACEICHHEVASRRLGGSVLAECVRCGHLERDLADAPAHHRDAAYGGDPALDSARLALTYRTLVAGGAPGSVFEVGFGTGALLRRFVDAGIPAAGADPDQLQLAVDPVVQREATLFASGVEEVDPGQTRVDMVYGIHVLEHVVDPLRTLRFSAGLLNPGGSVHFLTPAGDWDGLRLYRDG